MCDLTGHVYDWSCAECRARFVLDQPKRNRRMWIEHIRASLGDIAAEQTIEKADTSYGRNLRLLMEL